MYPIEGCKLAYFKKEKKMALPSLKINKLGDHAVMDHTELTASEIFQVRQGGVHLGWIAGQSHMKIRHGDKPGEIIVQFLPWHLRPDWPKSEGQLGSKNLDDPTDPQYVETIDALHDTFEKAPKGGDRSHPFGDESYNKLKHWKYGVAEVMPEK